MVCLEVGSKDVYVYICGFVFFMDVVVKCVVVSCSEEVIYLEYFVVLVVFVVFVQGVGGGDVVFEVKLVSLGKVVQILVGIFIVDILVCEGIVIDIFCCEGICGICVVLFLEGELDYCDNCFFKKEKVVNDQICICVLRVRLGMLVLDF